jgi:hypothetical protein
VLWGRPRLIVAFDAAEVWGILVRRGLAHVHLVGAAHEALAPGALSPGPLGRNLLRLADVRAALQAVCSQLGLRERQCVDLILHSGIACSVLLAASENHATPESLRFRLAATLPYPATDAVVGTIPMPCGRLLAAAARRGVVAEYEAVAEAAGLRPRRVELAPLVAYAGLLSRPLPDRALDIVLGSAALSLARWDHGSLGSMRTRLRSDSHDDSAWLAAEVARVTDADGHGNHSPVRIAGAGAGALSRELRGRGREALLAWDLPEPPRGMEPAELCWLGGVLQ